MSEFEVQAVVEQECVHDGEFELPFDSYLLMKMINHNAAACDDEEIGMENPKRMIVRVTVSTKEI